jgi:hypothetical protein
MRNRWNLNNPNASLLAGNHGQQSAALLSKKVDCVLEYRQPVSRP